jgi:ankyrin repeat protein
MLLAKESDVNLQSYYGATPLFIACFKGNKDIVKLLLSEVANINHHSIEGEIPTPLLAACDKGFKDIVKMLLDKDADVNIRTLNGVAPIDIARSKGYEDIVNMLL